VIGLSAGVRDVCGGEGCLRGVSFGRGGGMSARGVIQEGEGDIQNWSVTKRG
jgi:hypothetical protein